MTDICCIGHITLDKIITPGSEVHMPGGTSFYFSNALANLEIGFTLLTALAAKEEYIISGLRAKGIHVEAVNSAQTVCFENIYHDNQDHRTQRVTQKADPFRVDHVKDVHSRIFHLGPLLADDIPIELIRFLSGKAIVSLDVQGYLRKVENERVLAVDWEDKRSALSCIDILKANEYETEVLTGRKDIRQGALDLAAMGVKEVVITLGSAGSLIYTDGIFYEIPAYKPTKVIDATGCGDTYMAGYLYQKAKGAAVKTCGEFGAAMATLKIEASGPFTGSYDDVMSILRK